MFDSSPVIDADSHKCENPVFFFDYIPQPYRDRVSLIRDRYGEQRFCFRDVDPRSGRPELERVFLQVEGFGKGTFRPYHPETTIGGLFNHVRIEHMDREGIDHQVIYGSIPLSFGSLIDTDFAVALCRAYNDYICDDTRPYADRLHPVGVLPLQDPTEAVTEARRCIQELGMAGVTMAPHQPVPHPDAPERFPAIRVPKPLSHPDFHPIFRECEALDAAIGLHGAPGVQLAGGSSDQLDTFTLVHVFANRSMQQMALAKLIFDGVFEAFPRLRFGFLEAGAGWLPDLMHSLHEHWEKRIAHFDPSVEPSPIRFMKELARERGASSALGALAKSRLVTDLFSPGSDRATREELAAFRHEHPALMRDPLDYLERSQFFVTIEPDDPCPPYLASALGEAGRRVAGVAIDYGHWDATLPDCVASMVRNPEIPHEYAVQLLSSNTARFYGRHLENRMHIVESKTLRSLEAAS